MENSLQPSTRRTYSSAVKKYYKFCTEFQLFTLPATERSLELFVCYLFQQDLKASTINVYLSGVRNLHIANGYAPPDRSESLKLLLSGAKKLSAPPERKLPITYSILCLICQKIKSRVDESMLTAAFCTCFYGCLRSGEICITPGTIFNKDIHLCVSDVEIDNANKMFSLYLKHSKTDRSNQGVRIFIGCSKEPTCAFCSMKSYLEQSTNLAPNDPLFQDGYGNVLNRETFIKALRLALAVSGIDPKNYSGHSLRAGSATTAADNLFDEHEIKRSGRWNSDAYQIYLRNPKSVATFAKRLANAPLSEVQNS